MWLFVCDESALLFLFIANTPIAFLLIHTYMYMYMNMRMYMYMYMYRDCTRLGDQA